MACRARRRYTRAYGDRLLAPEEMRKAAKQDVSAFGPTVQFRCQRELEPPDPSEGFSRIDVMPFEHASQCLYVGSGAQDPGFARRLGFQYGDAADFFARGSVG